MFISMKDLSFDGKKNVLLPCFGNMRVFSEDKIYRTTQKLNAGWYDFEINGKYVTAKNEADVSEIDNWELPTIKGYIHNKTKFVGDSFTSKLNFSPKEDLDIFTPITAKIWFDGSLIHSEINFEDECDVAVRDAFEDSENIAKIKHVTPALRTVYDLEVGLRNLKIKIAEDLAKQLKAEETRKEQEKYNKTTEGRLKYALKRSGSELINFRKNKNQLIVKYKFSGRKFECVVDYITLRIIDSGICLTDHETGENGERRLTLSSLPSAIREAIDGHKLHVYRHVS